MVVCLCSEVRKINDNDSNWWGPESSQYWPTESESVLYFCDTITVTLLEVKTINEDLKMSKLHVKKTNNGIIEKEDEVTHLHFSGWPDLDVPERGIPR